jgi:hypothetical protein
LHHLLFAGFYRRTRNQDIWNKLRRLIVKGFLVAEFRCRICRLIDGRPKRWRASKAVARRWSREGFQGHGERADGAQLRRALAQLAQLDKGDVLTVTRLDHRRRKQPRRTSDSQINKKRPPALPQAAQVREETPKEGVGATILLHRNNIARAAHKKQGMLT